MDWIGCDHCEGGNTRIRCQIIANGLRQFGWYCLDCQRWAEKPIRWLAHTWVEAVCQRHGKTSADIPAIADFSNENNCIICGQPGEMHHWAPQALKNHFGEDYWRWPMAALCVLHHRLWHNAVTPHIPGFGGPTNGELSPDPH